MAERIEVNINAIEDSVRNLKTALATRTRSKQAVDEAKPGQLQPARDKLEEAENKVAEALETLRFSVGTPSGSEGGNQTAPGTSQTPTTKSESGLEESFGKFIESVGSSVAEAQKQLDQQARESFGKTSGADGPLLPTLYRIPKLTADVKFAFTKKGEEKLNLVFYSKAEEASTLHQQSISFEIAAIPLPPELQKQISERTTLLPSELEKSASDRAPSIRLVVESETRKKVFDAISTFQEQSTLGTRKLDLFELEELDDKVQDRVLIVEAPELAENPQYLLFYADAASGTAAVGIWHVDLQVASDPKVKVVIRFSIPNAPGEEQKVMRDFVAKLGELQSKSLPPAKEDTSTQTTQ
ncbi:MAG TPA: hypothetical protein PLX89_20720 [Verrucomicrobiota bacterium]|nr:hypothetical protein [Verrucomicrobiales bacterium]HRI15427.1 hypothetical protein [Verrucomicrobiota bacterium]